MGGRSFVMEDSNLLLRTSVSVDNTVCDVRLGNLVVERLSRDLRLLVGRPRNVCFIYNNDITSELYELIERQLIVASFTITYIPLDTNTHSDIDNAMLALSKFGEAGITKDDIVVAVGDTKLLSIANFVCSNWMRSIKLVGIPTNYSAVFEGIVFPRLLSIDGLERLGQTSSYRLCLVDSSICRHIDVKDKNLSYAYIYKYSLIDGMDAFNEFRQSIDSIDEIDTYLEVLNNSLRSISSIYGTGVIADRLALEYGDICSSALMKLVDGLDKASALSMSYRFLSRISAAKEFCDIEFVLEQDHLLDSLGLIDLGCIVDSNSLFNTIKETKFLLSNRFMLTLPYRPGRVRMSLVEDDMLQEHCDAWCKYHQVLLNS